MTIKPAWQKWIVAFFGAALCWISVPLLATDTADAFYNPIISDGADPWVLQKDGFYYYTHTTGWNIEVRKSTNILGSKGLRNASSVAVFTPPGPNNQSVWAPELHYLNGKWYIYYAADDGPNEDHRMYVAESSTTNAQGSYVLKAKISDSTDRWAIDGTVLQGDTGGMFFVWSGWPGDVDGEAQNLYIAPMSNPWTISGPRVQIATPAYGWEGWILEGPQILKHGGKTFIVYSANASWTDEYCLGLLTCTNGNFLDPASWKKKSTPIFRKYTDLNGAVYGPGHCSFTKSPDLSEDWILHHSAKYSGAGWTRHVRAQPFTWNADGSPNLGNPVPPNVRLSMPSGDAPIPAQGTTYQLAIRPEPAGTVLVSPNQSSYLPGTMVTLTATNSPGLQFVSWAGDAWGTNRVLQVKMDRHKTITAYFTPVVIIGNEDAIYSSSWPAGSAFPGYGPDYQYAATTNTVTQTAIFRPDIQVAGKYDIHVMHSAFLNRSAVAPHTISTLEGTNTVYVNQQTGGAQWQLLAAGRRFERGTTGFVQLSNKTSETNKFVMADAVRFLYCTNQRVAPSISACAKRSNGEFEVELSDSAGGLNYVLQGSSNLTKWTALQTNKSPNGVIEFLDPEAKNAPKRFYRAVGP